MVHYVVIVYFTTISFEAWSRGKGGKGAPSNGHVVPKAAAAAAGTGQVVPPRSRAAQDAASAWEIGVGGGGECVGVCGVLEQTGGLGLSSWQGFEFDEA